MSTGSQSGLVTGLTLVATLGGFLFGYDTAVISGAVTSLEAMFVAPRGLSDTAHDSLLGFTVSSALFGCVLGGAVAGWIANRLGRKRGLMLAAALFLVSAIGSAWPELGWSRVGAAGPEALFAFNTYRIIGGVAVGIASMLAPLYIAEIAPRRSRGRLVSYNQMAIVLGIVGVYFVNWVIAAQGDDEWLRTVGWRWMFASETVPAALFLALLAFVPETPRWLVQQKRPGEARAVLERLGDEDGPDATLAEIERSLVARTEPLFAYGPTLILIGVLLSVFQQFVGINAVLYYAPLIFENMGASTDTALLQTTLVGGVNMAATLIAIFTVDRFGRKPLMLIGAAVMAAAMLVLGTLFATQAVGIGALIAILVYIAGFAMSWGPVVWVLLAEIFPNTIRGKALAIAVTAQWLANLFVSWSFKILDGDAWLVERFHHGFAYWIYGLMSVLAFLFVWRFVPETKGRSLEAMRELWKAPGAPHASLGRSRAAL